jgi:serine/threonine protein kinase
MQLSGYQVGEIIGQGGMATVYRTEHILLKQERALKVMSPELTNQPGFKESFIREGQFIAALKHSNIVTIYDISEQEGVYFMAMEYLHGGSLEDQLPLPLDHALNVVKQIGSALYYAHQQKIIHRDIKPANILFNAEGDAILTDFGISKLEDIDSDLTRMGYGVVGTARYMSPEQTGGEKLDKRSDLYSLALVFYEMLSGEKAIQSTTRSSIIREHAVAPAPTLPTDFAFLQPVLNKALAKTAEQRYPDMRAFVEALVIAKTSDDLRAKTREHQRALFIRVSAVLFIIVAIFITFALNREEKKEQVETENNRPQAEIVPSLPIITAPKLSTPSATQQLVSKPRSNEPLPLEVKVKETIINLNTESRDLTENTNSLSETDQSSEKPKKSEPVIKAIKIDIPSPLKQPVAIKIENTQSENKKEQVSLNIKEIETVYKTVRVSPYLLIYDKPNANRIGQLRQGIRIQVTGIVITESGEGWSRIQFNDQPSYVKTSQLK